MGRIHFLKYWEDLKTDARFRDSEWTKLDKGQEKNINAILEKVI